MAQGDVSVTLSGSAKKVAKLIETWEQIIQPTESDLFESSILRNADRNWKYWDYDGVVFKIGTPIKGTHKGKEIKGRISAGSISVENHANSYLTFSMAAGNVIGQQHEPYPDGWNFWKYERDDGVWEEVKNLKKKSEVEINK